MPSISGGANEEFTAGVKALQKWTTELQELLSKQENGGYNNSSKMPGMCFYLNFADMFCHFSDDHPMFHHSAVTFKGTLLAFQSMNHTLSRMTALIPLYRLSY